VERNSGQLHWPNRVKISWLNTQLTPSLGDLINRTCISIDGRHLDISISPCPLIQLCTMSEPTTRSLGCRLIQYLSAKSMSMSEIGNDESALHTNIVPRTSSR
jgi:hypothetical protein